jgi:hypothetical protein
VLKNSTSKFFFSLFLIGLFNNSGYVMVGSSASWLADEFNKEKLMPLFQVYVILKLNSKLMIDVLSYAAA